MRRVRVRRRIRRRRGKVWKGVALSSSRRRPETTSASDASRDLVMTTGSMTGDSEGKADLSVPSSAPSTPSRPPTPPKPPPPRILSSLPPPPPPPPDRCGWYNNLNLERLRCPLPPPPPRPWWTLGKGQQTSRLQRPHLCCCQCQHCQLPVCVPWWDQWLTRSRSIAPF